MHFGLYLKQKGILSAQQLVAAIEEQFSSMVPIGQLALEEGVMSARDIFDVLQAQSDSPSERFGDLAVELGMMAREDLMRLLMIQADRKRPIAEILIEQGVLTLHDAARELTDHRRSQLRPRASLTPAKSLATKRYEERAAFSSDSIITV